MMERLYPSKELIDRFAFCVAKAPNARSVILADYILLGIKTQDVILADYILLGIKTQDVILADYNSLGLEEGIGL